MQQPDPDSPPAPAPETAAGASASALGQRVAQRLRRQMFVLGRRSFAPSIALGLMTTAIFYLLTRRPEVFAWSVLVHGVQAVRWAFVLRNERLYPAARHACGQPEGDWRYVAPLVASGLAWGAAPWLLLPPGPLNLPYTSLLLVTVYGLMAGSIPAVSVSRGAIFAWLVPVGAGMSLYLAVQGGAAGWFLLLGAVMFTALIVRFALLHHRMLAEGLRSQFEKELLTEQLSAQKADLERLHHERTRFFAAASHDLRQPVHSLALFSEALRRELDGHPAQPMADQVVQATQSVGDLLNTMLDISKLDAGAVRPVLARVELAALLAPLRDGFEARAAQAGMRMRWRPARGAAVTDAEMVQRILSNFIDNAIKYAGPGTQVLVSARRRAGRLRLAVWDDGAGIAEAHLRQLFEEFYQVGNAHRDVKNGLGIGLAIVKRLAGLLDGAVGVRSVAGCGSVFWVDLPLGPAMAPPSPSPRGAMTPAPPAPPAAAEADVDATSVADDDDFETIPGSARERPPNVLLLDDEAAIGEAMRLWLKPYCGTVHVARNVEQARAIVERHGRDIDVMLVDFRLADPVNGIEATRLLRTVAGREVPAILVTGDTDPARVRAAYDSGLNVVFKPVQPRLLAQMLRSVAATPTPALTYPQWTE